MIRLGINNPENPIVIMGLSEGNILRLKNGQPIRTPIRSYGIDLPGYVVVLYGQTEMDIMQDLREAGMISEKTQLSTDPRMVQEYEIIERHEKVLIVTVGLPRSGKTTWAQSQAYPIVNPDAIRLAIHGERFIRQAEPFVWATAKAMVRALFLAGHKTVIVDATNTTRKRRDEWQSSEWATYFKVIDTPTEICLQRAADSGDTEIIPVIERMAAQCEPLADDESRWPSTE